MRTTDKDDVYLRRSNRIKHSSKKKKNLDASAIEIDLTKDSEDEVDSVQLIKNEQQPQGDLKSVKRKEPNSSMKASKKASGSGKKQKLEDEGSSKKTKKGKAVVRDKKAGKKVTKGKEKNESDSESDKENSVLPGTDSVQLILYEQQPQGDLKSVKRKEPASSMKAGRKSSGSGKKLRLEDEGSRKKPKKGKAVVRDKKAGKKVTKRKEKKDSDSESEQVQVGNSVFPGLRIRTSPKSFAAAMQCLSPTQKQCVKDMGFGSLLKFKIDELPAKLLYFVVDMLDDKEMIIRLGKGNIVVSPESIHDMLGVPIGGKRLDTVDISEDDDELTKLWKEQFESKKNISAKKIKKQIVMSNDANLNFKLNFIALFVNTLGACTSRGYADLDVLGYIKKDTNIEGIDWSRYLWNLVKNCKKGWDFSISNKFFSGPATILMLLYLDGTRCTTGNVERVRPAIRKWNYELMSYREEEEIKNGGFGLLELYGEFMEDACGSSGHNLIKEKQVQKGDGAIPTVEPQTVEEYISEMERIALLLNQQKKRLQQMAQEAAIKFPEADGVKDWSVRIETMFGEHVGVDNSSYKTPEKCVGKGVGVKTGEHMDDNENEEVSPFWYCTQLQRSVSAVEQEIEEKKKGKKQKSSLVEIEEPSFSLGMTQELNAEKGNEVIAATTDRGKENTIEEPVQSLDPKKKQVAEMLDKDKRRLKLPPKFKSPFVRRVVDIGPRINVNDLRVWELIADGTGRTTDVVFETKYGRPSTRYAMSTLARQTWVFISVIDSWAGLLNMEEEKRNISSPFRLFCHTGMTDGLSDEGIDDAQLMNIFISNLGEVVNSNPALMNLKNVDMVFFPIMQDSHYYLICYNMKTMAAYIIDSQIADGELKSKYKSLPEKLHQLFMAYLQKIGHASWKGLKKATPTVVEMNWRTMKSDEDCGVFLMRHMECFMGVHDGTWECGISTNIGQKGSQMGILRRKYTAKMLMSPQNLHLNKITAEATMYAAAKKKIRK